MDIQNNIKPATLEEAFGGNHSKTPNIIDINNISNTSDVELQLIPVDNNKIQKHFRNIFLKDENDFEDAELFYPSRMNDRSVNVLIDKKPETNNKVQAFTISTSESENESIASIPTSNVLESKVILESTPFILANTTEVALHHLSNDCIIPVFSKDNEKTIAHQEFIDCIINAVQKVFPFQTISEPEIRVSHEIKGRTPDAIYLNAKDLLEHQKTIYYERMAFIIRIPSITDVVNGNELSLCIGGVRSYNLQNLYNKKTFEKFKFFIGFQNKICCNMCVSTDEFLEDLRASTIEELQSKALNVMQNYNAESHLLEMKALTNDYLTEHQFAQLIGKARLYQHLPKHEKKNIPFLNFNDSHINTMAKDYYEDQNFCRLEDGSINLWNVFNLFTQANKSSYIDTFLDRNLNAFEFSKGLQKTLSDDSDYHWFLS